MKLIVNQDRNKIIRQTQPLGIAPIYHVNHLFGYSLTHGDTLLGTYDEDDGAFEEAVRIELAGGPVVFVSGHHKYSGKKLFHFLREFCGYLRECYGEDDG